MVQSPQSLNGGNSPCLSKLLRSEGGFFWAPNNDRTEVMKKGAIIAVTGGPRTGKSTFVKLLAQRLHAVAILEGEEKYFPKRILDDIAKGKRVFELLLWFRNKLVTDYQEALRVKAAGRIAVLDTFYETNRVYVDAWIKDRFERQMLQNLLRLDAELLPWPDLVVVLESDAATTQVFAKRGNRTFENPQYIKKQLPLHRAHARYFRSLKKNNILFMNRTGRDFFEQEELNRVAQAIQEHLS